ncbi:hypothetical protein [Zobellia roscoffensis]|uniref:hypothetical protein n=1 Tax=Zobellia roscoffensis TaxID=2779508 RepID=UPI00188ABCEB|nr:hypothetical protein [Zobellia roscoffensis]
MGYIIKGNLRACLYLDFYEALDNVQVNIYKALEGVEESSAFKNQLEMLSPNAVMAKEKRHLGTGFTDEDGNYRINVCDLYTEGAIEIDLVVSDKLATLKKRSNPIHFTARRLMPIWRNNNNKIKEFSWNYSFSFQFWSQLRRQFDIWTILGNVKSAVDKTTPIKGVVVSAIDVDWVKDDFLGSAVSDSMGQFRIDYKSIDFKQTYLSPLISIETPISSIPGPGVYFKIHNSEGILLYEENRAMGKTQQRRNIPRCFNIDLYI